MFHCQRKYVPRFSDAQQQDTGSDPQSHAQQYNIQMHFCPVHNGLIHRRYVIHIHSFIVRTLTDTGRWSVTDLFNVHIYQTCKYIKLTISIRFEKHLIWFTYYIRRPLCFIKNALRTVDLNWILFSFYKTKYVFVNFETRTTRKK